MKSSKKKRLRDSRHNTEVANVRREGMQMLWERGYSLPYIAKFMQCEEQTVTRQLLQLYGTGHNMYTAQGEYGKEHERNNREWGLD